MVVVVVVFYEMVVVNSPSLCSSLFLFTASSSSDFAVAMVAKSARTPRLASGDLVILCNSFRGEYKYMVL
jgi:hypothetical protein